MAEQPRILMVSMRRLEPLISRSMRYEFEDLIQTMDGVDLAAPRYRSHIDGLRRRLVARVDGALPRVSRWVPGDRPPPGKTYDLLFVGCQDLSDLAALAPLAPWRDAARFSVCYLEELFESRDLPRTGELAILRHFDAIFSGFHGSLAAFERHLGRPCRYLPFSVDTLVACPHSDPPARTIDFYAMGRRPERTHEALLRMARDPAFFYLYDTVGNAPFTKHSEHRQRLADLIQRSRYFLVNVGKANDLSQIGGQQQIGMRYFEGAAGGAVLIGEVPRTPEFVHQFGWPDSVVPLPYDSPDIAEVVHALDADPARVERVRLANVVNSLRKHDHVYRWGEVLSVAGLKPTPAMDRRVRLLEEIARTVQERGVSRAGAPVGASGAGALRSPEPV